MTPDLFPETLLISRRGEHIYTTSLKVAVYFEKNHRDVLRSIDRLLLDMDAEVEPTRGDGGLRNFAQPSEAWARTYFIRTHYVNKQNQKQPMYLMSSKGFALLAGRFTGAKALRWQRAFLDAFEAMEKELTELRQRYVRALDAVRPALRPVVEGTEAGLSRAEIAEPLGKSAAAVTYHRRRARALGLLQ